MLTLRPSQQEILRYQGGKMGISAVPGSGKTWTLSLLAASLVASGELREDQEVLVVTLVNSAVDNFYQRVRAFVEAWGLLPNLGYRVRTLHGLAHDIVRARPDLLLLDKNFIIVDEREADAIRNDVALAWLNSHPGALDGYLSQELEEGRRDWARRERLPELVKSIALSFIRFAKDQQLTPEASQARLDGLPLPLPLAQMGAEMYADYQRALVYRGAVDFDDLIRYALQVLQGDVGYLEQLRYQWPYILEDEAQDSSQLQERILRLLTQPDGNWVRVGDPNQAIYETFTTANPRYLRQFMREAGVVARQLPNSGRSTPSLIRLANYLVDWTQNEHPNPAVRDALQAPPYIEPTPLDDPNPNPPDDPGGIYLVERKYTPQGELEAVVDSLARWLPEHPEATVAALVPINKRGVELANELRRRNIDFVENLSSTSSTRATAGALGHMLGYLGDPQSPRKLAQAYRVWRRADRQDDQARARLEKAAELLRKIGRTEDFLAPGPERDWLEESGLAGADPELYARLGEFRELARRWQKAALLPIDQLVLTLAQDLLSEPAELAISHKLAVLLRRTSQVNPAWRLPELTGELQLIARNERRFLGFSDDDTGFDPERYKGKVVISTVHKAKGLEWERVYLLSANNYDFPSGEDYDQYLSEPWYIRGGLNLEAESLAQLQAAFSRDEYSWYEEGQATYQARLDYVRERLRLFYVGITRAKRELVVTWNSGRRGELRPALPFAALQGYWRDLHGEAEV